MTDSDDTIKVYAADGTSSRSKRSARRAVHLPRGVAADKAGNVWVANRSSAGLACSRFAPRVIGGYSRDVGTRYLDDDPGTDMFYLQNDNYVLPQIVGSSSLATGTDFSLSVANDECSNVILLPGHVCGVGVGFDPLTVGLKTDTLELDSGWREVDLSGTGAQSPTGPTGAPARPVEPVPGAPDRPEAPARPEHRRHWCDRRYRLNRARPATATGGTGSTGPTGRDRPADTGPTGATGPTGPSRRYRPAEDHQDSPTS